MKDKALYLKPVGGLCNRMRAIDSVIGFANKYGKKLIVFWGRDVHLNCKYVDLFKPSPYFDVMEERKWLTFKAPFPYLPGSKPTSTFKKAAYNFTKSYFGIEAEVWFEDLEQVVTSLDPDVYPGNVRSMKEYESRTLSSIGSLLPSLKSEGNSLICSAWRLGEGQNYAEHFTPIDKLSTQVKQTMGNSTNMVGIHIRRGDHTTARKHSGLRKFIAAIEEELKLNDNAKFFLATDCAATEAELLRLYPDRICYYKKKFNNRNSTEGVQEALIDLYCLSATQKILGSYFSSFSQVAAEISGIEEITIT